LQQLRAKWRTWREDKRQYKLERALSSEDRSHGGFYGTEQEEPTGGVNFNKSLNP
jgi:hypothetical protein